MTTTFATTADARAFLAEMYRSFLDPARPPRDLMRFVDPDYAQSVDGKTFDLDDFLRHAAAVKAVIASSDVTIERLVFDADQATIAEIRIVNVLKTDGNRVRSKVMAFYRLEGGKIRAVDEMTLLLKGTIEDRDLGLRL